MAVTPIDYRLALRHLAAGVTVGAMHDEAGRPVGLTASAVTSVSLGPPLVLVCVGRTAPAYPALVARGWVAVNLPRAEQEPTPRRFATSSAGTFAGLACREARAGLPLLEDTLTTPECRIIATHPAGDHSIFVGQMEGATGAGGAPLVFYDGACRRLQPDRPAAGRLA